MCNVISCCPNHRDKITPLIWTFVFKGYEFWCPHCDAKFPFFYDFLDVPENPQLSEYHKTLLVKTQSYIKAISAINQYNTEPSLYTEEDIAAAKKLVSEWVFAGKNNQ